MLTVTNRKRHMHGHQEHAHDNKSGNKRRHTPHLVRKQSRHGTCESHKGKRTNTGRMPIRLVIISVLALQANNQANANRSRQTIKHVKVKHVFNIY